MSKSVFSYLLMMLAALVYFWGLSEPGISLTGDQKVYLGIAKEMYERDQWGIPYLFGEPSFLKPPFQYWMTLLFMKFFSYFGKEFSNLSAFLPSVCFLIATAICLNKLLKIFIGNVSTVMMSGLVFVSMLGSLTFGTTAQMEIYLCFFISLSWLMALHYLKSDRFYYLVLAFVSMGILAIVKSPLYSVLWMLSFLTYILLIGRWELFTNVKFWLTAAVGTLVGSIWYIYAYIKHPEQLWYQYFVYETIAKKSGNGGSILSIWYALVYFTFPLIGWTFLSFKTLLDRNRRSGIMSKFIFSWFWPAATFFTIYPYRNTTYLFVLLPAIAILLGWSWGIFKKDALFRVLSSLNGLVIFLVFVGLSVIHFKVKSPAMGVLSILCAGFSVWAHYKKSLEWILVASLILIFNIRMGSKNITKIDLKGLSAIFAEIKNVEIGMLDTEKDIWHEVGLLSFQLEKPIKRLYSWESGIDFIEQGNILLINDTQIETSKNKFKDLTKFKIASTQRLKRKNGLKSRQIFDALDSKDRESSFFREYRIIKKI